MPPDVDDGDQDGDQDEDDEKTSILPGDFGTDVTLANLDYYLQGYVEMLDKEIPDTGGRREPSSKDGKIV